MFIAQMGASIKKQPGNLSHTNFPIGVVNLFMFAIDLDIISVSTYDNFVFVSTGLLLVRSVIIVLGIDKAQNTVYEELIDFCTRLMFSVYLTILFLTAIYLGLVCGYYFGSVTLRVNWILYGL